MNNYFADLSGPILFLFTLPFICMLLSIAVFPLIAPHFWEKNHNKAIISLLFGGPVAVFFLTKDYQIFAKTFFEYGAFITLLAALFIISGGIYIRGSYKSSPKINMNFLAIGALLANIIGTTGASMMLIRPLIRVNQDRHFKAHTIIFFIFIVSNCAGLLTPLGDPPLFLGFLKGVPFTWTLRLWPQFLFMVGSLLLIYFFIDSHFMKKEPSKISHLLKKEPVLSERFGIEGRRNLIFLGLVVILSMFAGSIIYPLSGPMILNEPFGIILSELIQIFGFSLLAFLSFRLTPAQIHKQNYFSFHPIIEVAVLFAGIFAAMIPALLILEIKGHQLAINESWHFFWLTGSLSSFLDNAPTYLTFTSLAKGVLHLIPDGLYDLMIHPIGQKYLAAISCGAVLMGANTYIGNGPNFMVKAIAEHYKIKMPGFFQYMLWSFLILIPLFVIMTFIFFK